MFYLSQKPLCGRGALAPIRNSITFLATRKERILLLAFVFLSSRRAAKRKGRKGRGYEQKTLTNLLPVREIIGRRAEKALEAAAGVIE